MLDREPNEVAGEGRLFQVSGRVDAKERESWSAIAAAAGEDAMACCCAEGLQWG